MSLHIELGQFMESGSVLTQDFPLPPDLIDAGWVCAFRVRVSPSEWFGGLAFPSEQSEQVAVGLLVLSNPSMPAQAIATQYKLIENDLRSRVAQAWAKLTPKRSVIRPVGFGKPNQARANRR